MRTFLCDQKNRDCPSLCMHSSPHREFESWNRILKADGTESHEIAKCNEKVCRCDWWSPRRWVKCLPYDDGTGLLFGGNEGENGLQGNSLANSETRQNQ